MLKRKTHSKSKSAHHILGSILASEDTMMRKAEMVLSLLHIIVYSKMKKKNILLLEAGLAFPQCKSELREHGREVFHLGLRQGNLPGGDGVSSIFEGTEI